MIGSSVTFTTVARGGIPPYSFAWTGLPTGCLPAGGNLTCTPQSEGTFVVKVTATDAASHTANSTVTLSVSPTTGGGKTGTVSGGGSIPLFVPFVLLIVVAAVIAGVLIYRRRARSPSEAEGSPPEESGSPVESGPAETPIE